MAHAFELVHDIDRNVPVYVLPWPSPEKEHPTIEEMASSMILLIKSVQTNGRYAVAGYSGGGILAYEITKQLTSSGNSVSFLGLIDTYATIPDEMFVLSETEMFLTLLRRKFPVFKTYNNLEWWDRVCKLSLNETIEEINKTNLDLNNIEWVALITKQRYNYQNIISEYKINSLPIAIHLFKAVDHHVHNSEEFLETIYKKVWEDFKKSFNYPKLGWEKFNLSNDFNVVSVPGDHFSMIANSENRSLLGKIKFTSTNISN